MKTREARNNRLTTLGCVFSRFVRVGSYHSFIDKISQVLLDLYYIDPKSNTILNQFLLPLPHHFLSITSHSYLILIISYTSQILCEAFKSIIVNQFVTCVPYTSTSRFRPHRVGDIFYRYLLLPLLPRPSCQGTSYLSNCNTPLLRYHLIP